MSMFELDRLGDRGGFSVNTSSTEEEEARKQVSASQNFPITRQLAKWADKKIRFSFGSAKHSARNKDHDEMCKGAMMREIMIVTRIC